MSMVTHWILRLYPRTWRERYEEEFLFVLQQCQPSWRDVLDILFCALTERWISFLRKENEDMNKYVTLYSSLRFLMLLAALLGIALNGYGLLLIRTNLDSTTLLGFAAVCILFLLYGLMALRLPNEIIQPGLRFGFLCGLLFGVLFGAYIALTNLINLESRIGSIVTMITLTAMGILCLLAGMVASWRTEDLYMGIRASIWTGLIGALLGLITMLILTYTYMGIINQNTLSYSGYLHSGIKDVLVFNVQDNLGGCFYTLLFYPIIAAVLGAVGAILGKSRFLLLHPAQ